MLTFEEIWKFTDTVGIWSTFQKHEAELFYQALCLIPEKSTVVEIGCEFGRSTSILAQATKERGHRLILIDPFVDSNQNPVPQETSITSCINMLRQVATPFTLYCMKTKEVPRLEIPFPIDFLHIDGDHRKEALSYDLDAVASHVKNDGFLACHDYDPAGTCPDVFPTLNEFVALGGWMKFGYVGCLGVWRRQ